jgi:hypothetical protein
MSTKSEREGADIDAVVRRMTGTTTASSVACASVAQPPPAGPARPRPLRRRPAAWLLRRSARRLALERAGGPPPRPPPARSRARSVCSVAALSGEARSARRAEVASLGDRDRMPVPVRRFAFFRQPRRPGTSINDRCASRSRAPRPRTPWQCEAPRDDRATGGRRRPLSRRQAGRRLNRARAQSLGPRELPDREAHQRQA